jgi:[protein-PII] uridylyltransferase
VNSLNAEALFSELSNARHPLPLYKSAIADFNRTLESQFRKGVSANQLLKERAAFMDFIMRSAWARFEWNENLSSWRKSRISLLAVGGYGRAELHPFSDIDLLTLLERSNYDLHRDNIQSFLALLWDIGLEVGHSVRSVKECRIQADNDVTVLTALMEARTLFGDDELRSQMSKQIAPEKIWSPRKFYRAKVVEQEERHIKYEHTEYSLEPNVKSSPGGLRDIQTVMWIAKRKFGTVDFDDLVEQNFLTSAESKVLAESRDFLWKIRFGLHLVAGREDDRLLFEHQQKLALMFGYQDGDQLAVEQFMQDYYRTALEVNHTNRLLLRHFHEVILETRTRIEPINEWFQLRNNYLEAIRDTIFIEHPAALIDMFVLMGNRDDIRGVSAATIRLVRKHAGLIDDDFRNDPKVTGLFLDLLRSRHHLFTQLRRMERYGILGTYLPEFARIIGQMQFDLFHVYTVDAHTLQVVRNMRRFRYKNQEQRFPIAAHIHHQLPKVELLYIAGLYHDIAKGMGGNHSELGIDIARNFCHRHGIGTWGTNLVCWLVENHLVMSKIAQREDIQDPEVIHNFALLVQDQVRLDYLYSLTVADINATNPTLWNSWRASLMRQLYLETRKLLRSGLENYVDRKDYIVQTKDHAIGRLEEYNLTREKTLQIWNNVDDDYFVNESVADIVWHTAAINKHDLVDGPLISIRDITSRRRADEGATQIFVYMQDSPHIFASIVSALDALALNVMDAKIASSATDLVFDTFTVLESDGTPVGDKPFRRERIRSTLLKYLNREERQKDTTTRRTPRALRQFVMKTEVSITDQQDHSILSVVAPDRPGLLAIIAQVFVEMNITVNTARINTLGEKVEDLFHVSKDEKPICDEKTRSMLTDRICQRLDSHVEKVAV